MITLSMFSCQNEADAIVPQNTVALKQKAEPIIVADDYIIGTLQKLGGGAFRCKNTDGICIVIPPHPEEVGDIIEVISKDKEGTTYRILQPDKVKFVGQE